MVSWILYLFLVVNLILIIKIGGYVGYIGIGGYVGYIGICVSLIFIY